MEWYEILIIIAAALFVTGVIAYSAVRRKKGGGCSGCCSDCSVCESARKKDKLPPENKK